MKRKHFASAFIVILILAVGFHFMHFSKATKAGEFIQPVTSSEVMDQIRSLGSPMVLVNFWASWCEPCKAEFPNILALRKKLADKGFKVVFISIDDPRDLPAAEAFLKQQKVDFPTFYKGDQSIQFVTEIYPAWQGAVPTSLLMNSKLKLLDAWEGDATLAEFEERIKRQWNTVGGGA